MEVLVPKLIAATEQFDMVPKRDHKGGVPTLCTAASDSTLPESTAPYFLKADMGPRYAAGGLLVKPLSRPQNTNNRFSIARIEGSAAITDQFLARKTLNFSSSHHAFLIDVGSFTLTVQGEKAVVTAGETVFVPAGAEFSLLATGRYSAAYVFASGGGLVEFLIGLGEEYGSQIIAEGFSAGVDEGRVEGLEQRLGVVATGMADGHA